MKQIRRSNQTSLQVLSILPIILGVMTLRGASRAADRVRPIIEPVGIEVAGERELLAGAPAALRVVLTDHREGKPIQDGRIWVRLSPAGQEHYTTLFRGQTDALGTVEATFTVPEVEPGDYDLQVTGRAPAGSDETIQRVRIVRRYQILLTTDKPIYQPTQTMHIRALALRQPDLSAVARKPATIEVRDGKGNKVFKKPLETNAYGIAATDFVLADEINMGSYEIKCLLEGQEAVKTVTVERYVLPKFDVEVTTDKQYYLPGDTVSGTVQADYFYGVPVREAQVEISIKTFDVEYTEIATVAGTTDQNGTYKFEATLPRAFVGQPVEQGGALLQFDTKVTNKAQHTETSTVTRTVAQDPIQIQVVPESGKIVPGVENILYVSTTYPDGSPAPCMVELTQVFYADKKLLTKPLSERADDLGLTEFTIKPNGEDPGEVRVQINAQTEAGERATREITLESDDPGSSLLLRLDRRLAKVGDTIHATVFSADKGRGAVYLDVVKDRQTMLTQAAEVKDGCTTVNLGITPNLTGSIWVSAYRIQSSGTLIRDTAPMFGE
ncbi:MAG: MG2 domain-containing protein, partial [Candidatus Zipacnadales bacterium]